MMNELTNTTNTIIIKSMEVAEMVEKDHSKLLRDIRTYTAQLNEAKIGLVDFFTESSYVDSKGETRPCYDVTKKGCEFIAHKMTGTKGTAFTAKYINRFHEMENMLIKDNQNVIMNEINRLNREILTLKKALQSGTANTTSNEMTYSDRKRIKSAVGNKVVEILGGKNSKAYSETKLMRKAFTEIYKTVNRTMCVSTYKNTAHQDVDRYLTYVWNFSPSAELVGEILELNVGF